MSSPHPILSAAPSFDHLDPLGADQVSQRLRDGCARLPNDAAAHRFIHTPGPAELAGYVADDRLQHGDRTFGAGLGGLTLTMVGVFAATLLRHFGIC